MTELAVALALALRVVLPGWAWSGRGGEEPERGGAAAAALEEAGRAIALGLALNLLTALCLAQGRRWTPGVDWAAWAAVVLAGWLARPAPRSRGLAAAAAAAGCVACATAVLLWLPPRSEWFAGGWDPGLYQNAAVVVAREGGFAPRTDSVYAELTPVERELFLPQAFPAVPLHAATGAIQHYFFQLTPICGALFFRIGGLALLARMSQVLAWIGLPVLFALAGSLGLAGARRAAVLLAWCVAPLWWYQQAVPTTEALQLLLVCGAAAWYLDAERRGDPLPLAAALALAASGVNHFGFPPLLALLLVFAAGAESAARRPGRVGRLATCLAGLAAGLVWDLAFSSVTIARLQARDRVLPLVLAPFVACAAAALWLGARSVAPSLAARIGGLARRGALAVAAALAALTLALSLPAAAAWLGRAGAAAPPAGELLFRLERFLRFHGAAWFALLALGAAGVARERGAGTARVRVLAAALGAVALLLFLSPGIAPIYPWAFRRHVVFLAPLAALLLGCGLTALAPPPGPGRGARAALGALPFAALLSVGGAASLPAARVGEYVGYPAALAAVDAALHAGDLVVADDPRAGTPLLLMFRRDVLDGSRLWKSADPEYRARYLGMLRRLARERGRRVLWLTSTEQGLGVYPEGVGATEPLGAAVAVEYATVVQSSRAGAFATANKRSLLQLHRWQP